MDRTRNRRKQQRVQMTTSSSSALDQEVSSAEWEPVNMTEQEEDLVNRMYKLVGPRWDLIAGRIPGRKPEEIERFWILRQWRHGFDTRNNNRDDDSYYSYNFDDNRTSSRSS